MEPINLTSTPLYITVMVYVPITELSEGGQFIFITQCLHVGCQYNIPLPIVEKGTLDTEQYLSTYCGHAGHHQVKLLDHMIEHYDMLIQSN